KRYRATASAIGLDVRKTIRPPLSPHRLGLPVRLRAPEDPAEALNALCTATLRPLSSEMTALLRDGDFTRHGGYRSRSETILGIALAAVNAGWIEHEFFEALMDPEPRAGDKIRGRRDRRAYVARCWKKATEKSAASPAIQDRAGARAKLGHLRAAA